MYVLCKSSSSYQPPTANWILGRISHYLCEQFPCLFFLWGNAPTTVDNVPSTVDNVPTTVDFVPSFMILFSLLLFLSLRNDLIASYLLPCLVVTALACIMFLPYRSAPYFFFSLYLRFLLLYLLPHNVQYQHKSSQQVQNITKPNLTWNYYCHSLSFCWKIRASISLLVKVSGEYFSSRHYCLSCVNMLGLFLTTTTAWAAASWFMGVPSLTSWNS